MGGIKWSEQEIKDYKDAGHWKCVKSPSGAHHWDIAGTKMKCRYCDEERTAPVYMNAREIYKQKKGKYARV